ncbi:MAG: IclR family transcriptional regulator [Alphaproteobacteria bacterium]|nr:IclR family transcriptional regulator [Alphaproteobacteria bacterium]TAD89969.1 MAG: IclR family transcriptional regulator [Alphaproteobacteria bacterium]
MSSDKVAAVERAFSILGAFREEEPHLSLVELSRRTGLYKSTILRLAASLERCGYLRRMEGGGYRIGPTPLALGRIYQAGFRIGDAIQPILTRLAEASSESASFSVRDGDTRIVLHRVESPRRVRDVFHVGDRLPLRGAGGKVLLAFAPGPAPAEPELLTIRAEFVATSVAEASEDTAGVASPVFGSDGALVGAIGLSGPLDRFTATSVAWMRAAVPAAAMEATQALGGDAGVFPRSKVRIPGTIRRNA